MSNKNYNVLKDGPTEDMLTLGEDAFCHYFHLEIKGPRDSDLFREAMSEAFIDMYNKMLSDSYNARLIDAAPDLLDALIKLSNEAAGSGPLARECIGNTNALILEQRVNEARAVIAKTLGEDKWSSI